MGPTVVVVRKRAGAKKGHHGGAWKVAYADFITALMAFFLVMWLVGQNTKVKAGIANYFRDPGVFETTRGQGVLDGGAAKAQTPDQAAAERAALERSVAHIRERLDKLPELQSLKKQVEFTITGEGLRIDLLESSGSSFFDSGSASMHPETERVLGIIARELGTLDNQVVLEGHTDSRAYTESEHYTNWELSADRANAARRIMERQGLRGDQVVSVRGHADRQLRVPANPLDPRNRRVSVVVKSHAS